MKNIFSSAFLFFTLIFLSSCLKDKAYEDGLIGHKVENQNIIELAWPNNHDLETPLALDIVDKDTSIRVLPVRLASGMVASQDITITLDTTITTDYINDHLEDVPNLRYFNASVGSLESGLTVTIPAGSNEGYIVVKVNSANFNPAHQYVLGYAISSIGDANTYKISGLLNSHILLFSAKNIFDGIYEATGTHIDYANAAFTGSYPFEYHLISQGPNSVAMWDNTWFGDYIHTMLNAGGASGYGSFAPVFIIDLTTGNVTSVVNYYGQPAGNSRSAEIDPSGVNKYDFDTKTLRVKYWMNQPTAWPGHRVSFDEIFRYIGPR